MELNNGIHLIIDVIVKDIKNPNLCSENIIEEYLDECIKISDMEEVASMLYKFEPNDNLNGITSIRALSTSHISIHTWPENNYISIDLFSCKYFNVDNIIEYTKNYFNAKRLDISIINRDIGIPHKYINYVDVY
jgi:S-adenosylmethionine decarboxylase proenzyme